MERVVRVAFWGVEGRVHGFQRLLRLHQRLPGVGVGWEGGFLCFFIYLQLFSVNVLIDCLLEVGGKSLLFARSSKLKSSS